MKRLISLASSIALAATTLLSGMSLTVNAADVIKVACVGDSITAGQTDYNYPKYLQAMLGNEYEVTNFGKGGAAVRKVLENVDGNGDGVINEGGEYFWYDSKQYTSSLTYDADIVFVMMGTNDALFSNFAYIDDYYKTDYKAMIQPYIDAGSEVILATSPYAYSIFLSDTDNLNVYIRQLQFEIAEEMGLEIIDVNTATANRSESFPDGLHGNASGYMLIAQTFYEQVFDGTVYTFTANTGDAATITLETTNSDFGDYVFKADDTGLGTIPVLPGTYNAEVKCGVYQTTVDGIVVAKDTEVTFTYDEGSVNYALSATVTADSENAYVATNAKDGDEGTRWQAASQGTTEDPSWLRLDFGSATVFDSVIIIWETARASVDGYVLEISDDGKNWTTVTETERTRDDDTDTILFDAVTARYLRVYCTVLDNTKYTGPSIYEIEVYNVRSYSELTVAQLTLENALNRAAALSESDYTAATWATLAAAVSAGKTVSESGSETASDYTRAAAAISTAIDSLESNAEGVLNSAVSAAGNVVRYRYTPASLAVLDGYLAEAKTYEGATVDAATSEKMMTCADNINAAIAALVTNNLAAGKDVIIPSSEQSGHSDSYINDGSFTTRWASGGDSSTTPEHITVDFGSEITVDVLEVYWETARASADMVTVQYSQDNVVWDDVSGVAFGGDLDNSVKIDNNDCYYQIITFDAVKARYIRLYVVGTGSFSSKNYTQMSIWELEAYNSLEAELSASSAVSADFEILGAQTRTNANSTTDLRFVMNISANVITNPETVNEEFTAIGVIMARQDELSAAGYTASSLALDVYLDNVTVKNVETKYLRNVNVDKYGMYTYTVTITNITDLDRFYACRAYYITESGTTYSVNTAVKNANGLDISSVTA